jgi:hypothetical protein
LKREWSVEERKELKRETRNEEQRKMTDFVVERELAGSKPLQRLYIKVYHERRLKPNMGCVVAS